MRKIVFDIETSNLFSDVGSGDPAALDISVVCIHDSETDQYLSFLQEDFADLWKYIESADMLIGYNSDHFDIPLLNKYYPGDLTHIKSLDLLKEIHGSLGRRIKLDSVAKATLGTQKSGNGLQAIKWWRDGERQKVIDYCIQDVKVTKDIYDYALKNGKVKYADLGKMKDILLDTKDWEEKEDSSLTHTLPF
ncbi:ribonuclease H-like domain-containing protein [Candidatus Kaiserbacteria bacterium]|nr:MAG: ribonuclease H-like domain-containing protein [Candidatus Kaiserbacteria bacterium]